MERVTKELSERVALVTGASKGIGAAIARKLSRAGAKVAICYGSDQDAAEKLIPELAGTGHKAFGGDVRDPVRIGQMVREVEAALGPVDMLVANAGMAKRQSFEDISVEDWDEILEVNLRSAFLFAQHLATGMSKRGWGRIIFMSSVAAFTGGIIGPHYTASKAALIGLTHSLSASLAPSGVTVNAVAPALIGETGMIPGTSKGADQELVEKIPVKRFGHPEEVAEAIVMLATNPFITAQTLSVDGGTYPR